MRNNVKLIVALVAVGALIATVFALRSNTTNSSTQEELATQTGGSMDETSNITKAKQKLKEEEDAHTKNQPVDANTDVKAYVEAIGVPSEEDLVRIENAGRYGEEGFEAGLRKRLTAILGEISEESMQKIIAISMHGAYQFDVLRERYIYGEINKGFFAKGAHEVFLLTEDGYKELLTDEQYAAYSGGASKDQEIPNQFAFLATDEVIFSDFPNIMKSNSEIKSVDDLYAFVDPAIVADLAQFTEDHNRVEMQLSMQVENGAISIDESFEISDQNQASYDNYVRSILTPEQQVLFLGEPRDESDAPTKDDDAVSIDDDEEFDDTPIIEDSEEWNDLIEEGATPEAIREFNETGVLYLAPKEQK